MYLFVPLTEVRFALHVGTKWRERVDDARRQAVSVPSPGRGKPMPRGECTFRKRDLKVALEAAQEAGARLARGVIKHNGGIVLQMERVALSRSPNHADTDPPDRPGELNPWDDVLKTHPS